MKPRHTVRKTIFKKFSFRSNSISIDFDFNSNSQRKFVDIRKISSQNFAVAAIEIRFDDFQLVFIEKFFETFGTFGTFGTLNFFDEIDSFSECKDFSPSCEEWASNGVCGQRHNRYVKENCRASCGFCQRQNLISKRAYASEDDLKSKNENGSKIFNLTGPRDQQKSNPNPIGRQSKSRHCSQTLKLSNFNPNPTLIRSTGYPNPNRNRIRELP